MQKVRVVLPGALLFVLFISVLTRGSQAQVVLQDRLTRPVDSADRLSLAGTIHPMARSAVDQGRADSAKVLQGMSINFSRSAQQQANLTALLAAQQNPASPYYHKWLTPAQFGQQFGMSAADIARVSDWLRAQGFTITSVAQSSNSINFNGPVAAVEKAFQTEIHNYSVNGQTHFANSTQISLPAALAGVVTGVSGLNDFRPKPKVRFRRSDTASARFTSGVTGSHYLAPGDFATIYDVNPLYTAGFTGRGITIAIIGQTDIVPADITAFRAAAGLSVNNPTVVTVPGTTPETVAQGSDGDLAESDLDLEYSGAVASGASIILVNSGDVFTSLQYAIQNSIDGITVPIISMSYGECEAGYTTANLNTIEGYLQQANGQGQTVMLAAGDTGAADCDDSSFETITEATQGLAVDYPGSSPYVTDVGGTEFMGDGTAASPQTGSGTYWSANGSSDVLTSAKSYIPEMGWNDTTFSIDNGGGLSAGGGGVSALWPKPSWQTGVPNIPADGFRDVPDISLNASPDHDGYLYCTSDTTAWQSNQEASCNSGFRDSSSQDLTIAGGTSFAAPSFAGLLAIIEQKLATGGGLGNINPALYTLASNATTYASAFHDITTGNNQVPCVDGSPNCATTGNNNVIGYVAGTGYDQVTGLGSVDASNLATAYAALVQATGTTTTLAVTPGTSVVINEKVTFTATVAPNTLSTAPTGTVTFYVDGVAETRVTISTAAPYTAAYQTEFASAGTHVVTATYASGDSTYTGSSSSSVTVTVAASRTAATTTTVTANPTTIALGSSITLTATVSATTAGTLTGPVTFSIQGTVVGTVSQVTLGARDTATATLTVNATASLGFSPGTDVITAGYGGDAFNATSSGTVAVAVLTQATAPLYYIPFQTPCRAVDTRLTGGPIAGGTSRNFNPAAGACSIPSPGAGAIAYSVNVTVVPHGALGYLTVWPAGEPQPVVSTLNSPDGRVKANAAIAVGGSGGLVSVYASDTTDLVLDVSGYFTSDTTRDVYVPVTPCRIVDTRINNGTRFGAPSLVAGQQRTFAIANSSCSLPAAALASGGAVALNVTAVPIGGKPVSYVTVWGTSTSEPQTPLISTLNVPTGTVVANAAIVSINPSTSQSVSVFATENTDLILDITGYFAPASLAPSGLALYTLAPCRVLDTRESRGEFEGESTVPFTTGNDCDLPANAQAYVTNATVVPAGSLGFLTLWPDGPQPLVSTLNASDGFVTSNLAIVSTTNGSVDAYATSATQLILDVSGYFAAAPTPADIRRR